MSEHSPSTTLDLQSAAAAVRLPATAIVALVTEGYLAASAGRDGGLSFDLADLKAFVARNADNGSGAGLLEDLSEGVGLDTDLPEADPLRPEELVDLLDERAEAMAVRMLKLYATVFPDVRRWTGPQQGTFVRRTKKRFESVLAVASLGGPHDADLHADLRRIGASAAKSGTALPELLVMLRMSRDLVVQNAIELAASADKPGGFALSLLLTRILPTIDRLGDALAEGYWEAMFPS